MDKMKVISIRMTDEELQDIDKALQPHRYYKRSDFIRAAVQVLLNANLLGDSENPVASNRTAIYDALRLPVGSPTGINVQLKVTGYNGRSAKFNTIRKIIRRWAPPIENATQKYIDFVAKKTGIDQNQVVWFSDRKAMISICRAMAFVECGQWIDIEKFETAYDMLL